MEIVDPYQTFAFIVKEIERLNQSRTWIGWITENHFTTFHVEFIEIYIDKTFFEDLDTYISSCFSAEIKQVKFYVFLQLPRS